MRGSWSPVIPVQGRTLHSEGSHQPHQGFLRTVLKTVSPPTQSSFPPSLPSWVSDLHWSPKVLPGPLLSPFYPSQVCHSIDLLLVSVHLGACFSERLVYFFQWSQDPGTALLSTYIERGGREGYFLEQIWRKEENKTQLWEAAESKQGGGAKEIPVSFFLIKLNIQRFCMLYFSRRCIYCGSFEIIHSWEHISYYWPISYSASPIPLPTIKANYVQSGKNIKCRIWFSFGFCCVAFGKWPTFSESVFSLVKVGW